ncbi:MAG: hypothetical protein JWO08_2976 [Verrucomicrobiaceae bacterium]|nr:hypothetical protein [Verrucomicrobiaceae bacterium]
MIRAFVLLLLLSGLGWGLFGEQAKGRFRKVDETFVDFLLANARGQFKPDPAKLGEVVFVRLREEDKKEYSSWPPRPIDYLMVTKGLAAYEPSVLVVADPLSWPEPKLDSIPELAQTLLPIPSVVLAAEATEKDKADEMTIAFARDHLPSIERLGGESQQLTELPLLARVPEPALVPERDIGIITKPHLSLALRHEKHAVPSLVLAAISRATRTPYSSQRLHTGPGAGMHLGSDRFIPLETDGTFKLAAVPVPAVNGLELMTNSIIDADPAVTKTLGKGKTIVMGIDNDSKTATSARTQAQAIAGLLTLPQLHEVGRTGQTIIWIIAGLAGMSLLLLPKQKATFRTLALLFIVVLCSYVAFLADLVWFPLTIPASLILGAGAFTRLFGYDPNSVKRRKAGKFYSLR